MRGPGTALALLCLLAVSPAPAAAATGEGFPLEPGPNGLYWIPGVDRLPIPLENRVEEDSPFVLHELWYDPANGRLHAVLAHLGEEPVTAVTVELSKLSPGGEPLSAVSGTEDWAGSIDRSALERWEQTGLAIIDEGDGAIFPGETYTVEAGRIEPGESPVGRLVLSVPATVFLDDSWVGSEEQAERILGAREERARVLSRWSEVLEEAADGSSSEREALEALRSLDELIGREDASLRGPAEVARKTISRNLDLALRDVAEGRSSAREELERLAAIVRFDLRTAQPHVPGDGSR